jgi:bifunctional N-acetylglucosamine-1-phosphate-uridyltransferase/glucosamine-1-phosphate-acetyltransferase GlmU-like protein
MSLALVILTVETPLGGYSLAGQSGTTFLRSAVGRLGSRVLEIERLSQELEPHLRSWLGEQVQQVLMVRGDRPLLTGETLSRLLAHQERQDAPLAVLWTPDHGAAAACAKTDWLWQKLQAAAAPLTWDQIAQTAAAPWLQPDDPSECLLVNSLPALAEAERIARQRINLGWMQAGVQIVDPATTYVHATVTIGPGTIILPNTHLWGRTAIGESCRIGPNSIVRDSQIGDRCAVTASMLEEAVMEDESNIGPFGHLRQGAHLCQGVHMGNFGEVKNSTLGRNAKMGHFSYLGDAVVGENVNIGAGTITCNYDGVKKSQTIIHQDAFIGSDTMLVAPVEIGAGARIGAGSVVTHDIPAGAVAYGVPARVKQPDREEGEDCEPGK